MEQNQLERSLMKADKNSADIAWQWLSNGYEQIIVTASLRQLETLRLTFGIAILIAFHTCTHDSQHRAVRHNLVDDVQVMNETFSPSFFFREFSLRSRFFEKSFNYIIVVTEPAQTDVRSRSCRDWYVIDTSRRLLTALILLRLVKSVRKCVWMGVVEIPSGSWRTGDFFSFAEIEAVFWENDATLGIGCRWMSYLKDNLGWKRNFITTWLLWQCVLALSLFLRFHS